MKLSVQRPDGTTIEVANVTSIEFDESSRGMPVFDDELTATINLTGPAFHGNRRDRRRQESLARRGLIERPMIYTTAAAPPIKPIRAPQLTERIMLATEFVYIFKHYEALHGRAAALAHPCVQAARARYRRACAS